MANDAVDKAGLERGVDVISDGRSLALLLPRASCRGAVVAAVTHFVGNVRLLPS